MSAGVTRGVPTRCSSEASTLSSTSESELVLRWRRSSRSSTSAELARVGEIAVVREADAVRRVHVERLGFGGVVAAGGRITHVAHADVALELLHVVLLEHIAHQALALAHEQLALGDRGDARGILAAMLEHRQGVIDPLIDVALSGSFQELARCGVSHPGVLHGGGDSEGVQTQRSVFGVLGGGVKVGCRDLGGCGAHTGGLRVESCRPDEPRLSSDSTAGNGPKSRLPVSAFGWAV